MEKWSVFYYVFLCMGLLKFFKVIYLWLISMFEKNSLVFFLVWDVGYFENILFNIWGF